MTTARSPLSKLRAQGDRMAALLKAAERGEKIAHDSAGKLAAARTRESVKFLVGMDDKLLTIEMRWDVIRETSEAGLSEFIVKQMRERKDTLQ